MNTSIEPSSKKVSNKDENSELELLIRARYPIIYVVTWEENRVEQYLKKVAEKRKKQLITWTVTSGFTRIGENSESKKKGLSDPVQALETVCEYKEAAIYLFKDFHPFMGKNHSNTAVIRKLREVSTLISDSYKTLVITAPVLEISSELEKDITVIDFKLPSESDFEELFQKICNGIGQSSTVNLNITQESKEKLIQAALGLTLQEAENVFAKIIVNDGKLSTNDVSVVFSEKQQIIRKSGLLEYCDPHLNMEDVGGLEGLKSWLEKRAMAFTEKARSFELPSPKGVLLVGIQGCGKSLCAKAVSSLWNMPLLRFDMGKMFSGYVGSSEENVRRAIAVAESIAPVVLWADELDKAFSGSQSSGSTDGGTSARVMSTFLTWLSEKEKPVFVIATANDISQLPPELLRKGRLDEIFFVDLPNEEERKRIFAIHIRRRKREEKHFNLEKLARASEGFSGAEIEQAVISALYDAFYLDKQLEDADILNSLKETVPLSKTMQENIVALRAWADGRARYATPRENVLTKQPIRKLEMD